MKYRILLDAFTLRRDVCMNYVFAELLRRQGCEVAIGCCRNFITYLRDWKPDCVVVSVPSRIKVVLQYLPDVFLIFFPGEGGEPVDSLYETVYFPEHMDEFKRIDLFLYWGKYSVDYSNNCFPESASKRFIVGNPRLDIPKFTPLAAKRKEKSNSIGIVGRYTSINNFSGKATITSLTNDKAFKAVIRQCNQFHATLKLIEYIIKETPLNVSIRPHPLEAPEGYTQVLEKYPKDRISVDDSLDYSGWLCSQKMVFTPASTSFLEAYILEITTINIDRALGLEEEISRHSPFAFLCNKSSYVPKDIDELYKLINSTPKPVSNVPEIEAHLSEVHNWKKQDSALVNAVTLITNSLKQNRKPRFFRAPSFVSETIDWYYFLKATYCGSRLHPNFNYKKGYHKIPLYLNELVYNVINKKPQI